MDSPIIPNNDSKELDQISIKESNHSQISDINEKLESYMNDVDNEISLDK